MSSKKIQVSTRVSEDVAKFLQAQAAERDRSVSWLVNKLIQQFVAGAKK